MEVDITKVKQFVKRNKIFKSIVSCAVFVFPILCMIYLQEPAEISAFHYIWVAFYSCLLFCITFESKTAKILVCSMNGICVIGLTLLFLMGGAEIIPGVIWNAIVPFLPNPWY